MKIAFVPSTFLPWLGGAEVQTHNTANKLIEIGNEVDILILKKEDISNKSDEKKLYVPVNNDEVEFLD